MSIEFQDTPAEVPGEVIRQARHKHRIGWLRKDPTREKPWSWQLTDRAGNPRELGEEYAEEQEARDALVSAMLMDDARTGGFDAEPGEDGMVVGIAVRAVALLDYVLEQVAGGADAIRAWLSRQIARRLT